MLTVLPWKSCASLGCSAVMLCKLRVGANMRGVGLRAVCVPVVAWQRSSIVYFSRVLLRSTSWKKLKTGSK